MVCERLGALERILDSYSAYYDVECSESGDFKATATFHSRGERYLLVKEINMWSEEDHEYVYFYSGERLDGPGLSEAISHSLREGNSRITPGKDHRSSSITTVLVYDTVEGDVPRVVRRYSYHRSFKLMFEGWMDHRIALVDLSKGEVTVSRRGKDVGSNLRKILGL